MVDKREFVHEEAGLKRPIYYTGMMLTAEDFEAEQNYFLDKLRQHNRYLHGWGVVWGFEVFIQGGMVVVEPGFAVDCAGNQLLLSTPLELTLPGEQRRIYLLAAYEEKKINPVHIPGEPSRTEEDLLEMSRNQEICQLWFSDIDPSAVHGDKGPGTPGCGLQHPLPIASLRKTLRGWSVNLLSRR